MYVHAVHTINLYINIYDMLIIVYSRLALIFRYNKRETFPIVSNSINELKYWKMVENISHNFHKTPLNIWTLIWRKIGSISYILWP